MKARIIVACIFVPILFVIMFFLPPEATAALVALISAVGVYELLRPLKKSIGNAVIIISVITAPAVCAWRYFGTALANKLMFAWVLLFVIAVFCVLMFSKREEKPGYPDIAAALFGALAIPFFLSSLSVLRAAEHGRLLVLAPFVSAFISDGGAYFAGRALGKHKLAPEISPKKTVEGSVGGFIASAVFMLVYGLVIDLTSDISVSYAWLSLYGIIGSAVGQIGDLTFSYIKRRYGIKDFGTLLPGHGGILDRFDSLVFVAPLTEVLLMFFPLLG